MPNDLVVIEQNMKQVAPHFEQVLDGRMPVERLMRTVLVSCERTPGLLECTQHSILNAAMSAAVLGLEVDGVTGQAFLIPFKKSGTPLAQLVIGYKGMNTLAARSGYTVTAGVVREGDEFDYELGTGAFAKHKPKLGNKGRIIGAWAVGAAVGMEPIVTVLSIDEIMAVKAKSPGARKTDSPWNDPNIGFPAMAEKTARRRLARSMPLNNRTRDYLLASRMEEAFEEQGAGSFIKPDGELIIEGEASPIAPRHNENTPTHEQLTAPRAKSDDLDPLRADGLVAAREGMQGLQIWFMDLPNPTRNKLKSYLDETLKPIAVEADRAANAQAAVLTEADAQELLDLRLFLLPGIETLEALETLHAETRDKFANHPAMRGEWNAAYLEKKVALTPKAPQAA